MVRTFLSSKQFAFFCSFSQVIEKFWAEQLLRLRWQSKSDHSNYGDDPSNNILMIIVIIVTIMVIIMMIIAINKVIMVIIVTDLVIIMMILTIILWS